MAFLSACVFARFISESPEEVKADRTFDGAARVLRDYRLCEIKVRIGLRNRNQYRCSQQMYLLSTATEALGVRGRPWAPIGPSFGSPPFFSLKKTKLWFWLSRVSTLSGLFCARLLCSAWTIHGASDTLIDKPRSHGLDGRPF